VNAYTMKEDGSYVIKEQNGEAPFNIHREFFYVTPETFSNVSLF
jgi:polyphosphate kinase